MPKIDIGSIPESTLALYPEPFKGAAKGRVKQGLGDAAGLTQFGVNLTRLAPGGMSALKHWHENEDEFVFILEGEAVLIEGDEEIPITAGEAAGFSAGVEVGHQLLNRSDRDLVYLEVGTRAASERAYYPGQDLILERINKTFRFIRKDGTPY